MAGNLLTCFGRLFLNFLQMRGFTLGVEDILVTKSVREICLSLILIRVSYVVYFIFTHFDMLHVILLPRSLPYGLIVRYLYPHLNI